jgi:PAS domain S-box-containing protein
MRWGAVHGVAAWGGLARRPFRGLTRKHVITMQAEELLQHFTDAEPSRAIFLIDRDGRIANWNTGAQRLYGYGSDDILDRDCRCVFPPEASPAGLVARLIAEAEAEGRAETQAWQVRKDGSRFLAKCALAAMHGRNGMLAGFSVVTQDLTEQHRHQDTADHSADAQDQKLHAMGQLAGGIAHDFNNLLTVIIGSLDVLERRAGTLSVKEAAQLVAAVRKAATQGAALTGRLLAFSRNRGSAGQCTDVNRLLTGMSDLLRSALGDNIRLETRLTAAPWPTFIDPDQFQVALLNLVVNARDAMPRGGRLTIETRNLPNAPGVVASAPRVAADYVSIAVSDTGTGMPHDVLDRAFEPFFTTKPESKGTGLGLSQVRDFATLFGGEVRVSSAPGEGTRIELLLPRADADRACPPLEESPKKPAAAKDGETVLLVEDDPDVREFSAMALEYLGYRVWKASDAPSALRLLKRNPDITALLIDIGLPGASGRELAIEAQRCVPHVKIVLTTGAAACDGCAAGEESMLAKPFTVEGLSQKLDAVLHGSA